MEANTDAIFKALGDPTRRAIFQRLSREGEQTVHVLTDFAGVSQPAISKHLGALKSAGLVRDRRDGRETYYRAEPKGLAPLFDWMTFFAAFWDDRFNRLEDVLKKLDKELD